MMKYSIVLLAAAVASASASHEPAVQRGTQIGTRALECKKTVDGKFKITVIEHDAKKRAVAESKVGNPLPRPSPYGGSLFSVTRLSVLYLA
jgi:hypothetical protein